MAITWKKLAYEEDVVTKALFNANTILVASTDNTPAPVLVGASRVVARGSGGGIAGLTLPVVLEMILTTKGDLITRSGTAQRLGIGANDTVLTADSGEAIGMKWATPAAGANFASGSYSGNGVDDRQITTGFLCKAVFILSQATIGIDAFMVLHPSGADCIHWADTDCVDDEEKPYLHATDGFVLGDAVRYANNDGTTYKYVAFG